MTHEERVELIDAAKMAQTNSYAPYSRFHVGAAVRANDGKLYIGTNVENASYGLTMCAERAAVFNAVVHGATKITCVAISSSGTKPTSPCGACRQVIREFSNDNAEVVMVGASGDIQVKSIGELLPFNFSFEPLLEPT